MDSFLEKVIKKDCLRRYGLSVTDQAAFSLDYRSPKTFRTSLLIRHFDQGHGQKHVIPISPHLEHNLSRVLFLTLPGALLILDSVLSVRTMSPARSPASSAGVRLLTVDCSAFSEVEVIRRSEVGSWVGSLRGTLSSSLSSPHD